MPPCLAGTALMFFTDQEKDVDYRAFGFSVAAGLGHRFDMGLSIDFRFAYQFVDMIDPNTYLYYDDTPLGTYYRLMKFQLGVSYWF